VKRFLETTIFDEKDSPKKAIHQPLVQEGENTQTLLSSFRQARLRQAQQLRTTHGGLKISAFLHEGFVKAKAIDLMWLKLAIPRIFEIGVLSNQRLNQKSWTSCYL
jgi:hypothetical protein